MVRSDDTPGPAASTSRAALRPRPRAAGALPHGLHHPEAWEAPAITSDTQMNIPSALVDLSELECKSFLTLEVEGERVSWCGLCGRDEEGVKDVTGATTPCCCFHKSAGIRIDCG